jgi:hypothetical protein
MKFIIETSKDSGAYIGCALVKKTRGFAFIFGLLTRCISFRFWF